MCEMIDGSEILPIIGLVYPIENTAKNLSGRVPGKLVPTSDD